MSANEHRVHAKVLGVAFLFAAHRHWVGGSSRIVIKCNWFAIETNDINTATETAR